MITNHGVHEWQVVPGLPDTGGQNVYVNQFTEALIDLGYRVTIVNRGGYPHPVTGRAQVGSVAHLSGRARILYIEDGTPEFVPKEDMDEHLAALTGDLEARLAREALRYGLRSSPNDYWACSGAIIFDLYNPNHDGWVGEPAQLDHLGEDVTLVTITMGGNNLGFPDISRACLEEDDCSVTQEARVASGLLSLRGSLPGVCTGTSSAACLRGRGRW